MFSGGRGVTIGPIVSNYSDIFCDNERGSNFLWENDGYGQFNDIAKEVEIPDSNQNGRGVTLSDFNNDGKIELFCRSSNVCFLTAITPVSGLSNWFVVALEPK